jgi:hypothetical protein
MKMVYADMSIDHVRTYSYKTRGLDQQGKPRHCIQTERSTPRTRLGSFELDFRLDLRSAACRRCIVITRNKEQRRSSVPHATLRKRERSRLWRLRGPGMPSCRLSHVNKIRYSPPWQISKLLNSTLGVSMTGSVTCDFGSIYIVLGSV